MDEQMIEQMARAIFEAHNATYTVGGPAKWESDPEHWRRYARAAHSVIAGKVAELTEALGECAHWVEWCIHEHYAPDSSLEQAALAKARAALAPYPERRSE